MNSSIPAFETGCTARTAHRSLRRSLEITERAQHCAVLWFGEILQRSLYRELGYSSMNQYAMQKLGFSRAKTGDFLRLANQLEKLPALKESVVRGSVGYTKARELIKVATPRTEAKWVNEAQNSTRQELAVKVARVKKKAEVRRRNPRQTELLPTARLEKEFIREVPVRVALQFSAEQFARYEALWEMLAKLGGAVPGHDRADILLEALGGRIEELQRGTSASATTCKQTRYAQSAPPGVILHVHECPTCQEATMQTSGGEKHLSPDDLDRARCDSTLVQAGQRARTTIPPRIRREVLERDRHRCRAPGCTHTRFLEVHHKRPVSRGGRNEASNLVTLCGACHRMVHRGNAGASRHAMK